MSYLIIPPKFISVPEFLMKRYFKSIFLKYVRNMIEWSIKEYFEAIGYYSDMGDWKTVRFLNTSIDEHYILSKHPNFKWICDVFMGDESLWRELSVYESRFISTAYKLYQR